MQSLLIQMFHLNTLRCNANERNSKLRTECCDLMMNRKQVRCLGKYFTFSFFFSCFKWFFSGVGDSCGFDNFPSLGLKAYHNM